MPQCDVLIVGAGLTGLNLAYELQKKQTSIQIQVIEKSRGCGGRMATRRVGEIKYDHGAQFIKRAEDSQNLIGFWEAKGVAHPFPSRLFSSVCGKSGMTALAKKLVSSLESYLPLASSPTSASTVVYDVRATALTKTETGWAVATELFGSPGPVYAATEVVLTCPLPQALEILKNSGLVLDPAHRDLSQIQYSKALVFLFESEDLPMSTQASLDAYQENVNETIFSLSSQQAKGQSPVPAWTVVMSATWSETYFDKTEEEVLIQGQALLSQTWPELRIKNIQLKKWRYCQPNSAYKELFVETHPGLYLAGDAFGGGSLLGALRSSYRLFAHLSATR